jgi:hypothetical protein
MNIIIYCASYEKGEAKFDEIMNNLLDDGIDLTITKRKHGSVAVNNSNGNTWRVILPAGSSARGYKWHYAIVDDELTLNTYRTVILPQQVSPFVHNFPIERLVSFF